MGAGVWVWTGGAVSCNKFSNLRQFGSSSPHNGQLRVSNTIHGVSALLQCKGSSINYVIADRGGGVSPIDYGIT